MVETDEALYGRFLENRSEEAFRVLLERHREGLFLFIRGYVRNDDDAEELMLDAFAEAAAGRTLFSGKSSFRTWLFAIGKKKAFMYLRKIGRRQLAEVPESETAAVSDPPDLEILKGDQKQQLYKALEQLSPEYRQILTLLYFEQMSLEDIGKVMGKTRKQIYHLTERSRASLKDKLGKMNFTYEDY